MFETSMDLVIKMMKVFSADRHGREVLHYRTIMKFPCKWRNDVECTYISDMINDYIHDGCEAECYDIEEIMQVFNKWKLVYKVMNRI